nr:reverse transcriptase domain-containing protein [Tanacetum cinerariifolium]
MPYPRFTKIIINQYLSLNPSIPKGPNSGLHTIKDDGVISILNFIRIGKGSQGKKLAVTLKPTSVDVSDESDHEPAKRTRSRRSRGVVIQDTPNVPKKKQVDHSQKMKGIRKLSIEEQLVADTMQEIKNIKKPSRSQPHARGSSEGTVISPGVPNESTNTFKISSEGAGIKPRAPNEVNEEEIKWVSTDEQEEHQDDQDDDEMKDAEFDVTRKDNEEITYAEKTEARKGDHEQTGKLSPTSSSLSVSSGFVSTPTLTLTTKTLVSKILSHPLIKQQTTPILTPTITTIAPSVTTVVPHLLLAIVQRVSELEKDVKDLKQVNHSSAILASIRSHVPSLSVTAEEPDEEHVHDMSPDAEENIAEEMGNIDEHPNGEDPLKFDELMATPIDFSKFVKNCLKLDKITKVNLVGLFYNLLKGTCQSSIELAYNMEECYKALTDRLDWENPKGDRCLFDLSKPLPLKGRPGHLTIASEYFFNNNLEYLKYLDPKKKYATSITKTKASRSQLNRFSKHDVFFPLKILSVVSVTVNKLHGYGYLQDIVVRRDDRQKYKFKKDLFRACPHHGFTELHQLDTFYNALNPADQDSLNSATGGNLLERRTQDVLTIIENKSKVCNSRNKSIVSQVKSSDANSSSSSEIAKLTHAVNQQTSVVTTAMTAILKQFQETPPPASIKAVEEIRVTCGGAHPYYQCLAADGNTFTELQDNIQGYIAAAAVNYNQALLSNEEKLLELANTPLNENCSAVILKKLPEKLRDPGKFFIPCGFSELKCKALADLGASIKLMPLSVWKKLVGKFTFLIDFVIVDYESDPRVPLILGRPFLRTARALIDIHGEEMILRDESINMINIFNDSSDDFLENLFETNHLSGNPTFSSHPNLTSPKVKDDVFDPEGGNVLIEKLINLDSTKALPSPHNVNPLSGSTNSSSSPNHLLEEFVDKLALITFLLGNDDLPFDIESDLKEIEYLFNHDPIKEMDSILKDSVDKDNLAYLNDNLADTMPEMFTDEHALDYSSTPLYDEYDDNLFEVESDTEYAYDDPFDSKEEKIKESKLLIDELDPLRSSDFLPSLERCVHGQEAVDILKACHNGPIGEHHGPNYIAKKGIDFMGPFPSSRRNKYILVAIDYLSKWVEAKALPTNDARVVVKILKSLFSRFGTPCAIISDRGMHFCNDQFAKVMLKYGLNHRLATAYHPQTSRQAKVSNCGLKRILERTVGENHASWSDKLDDALWTFRTAFKTPIECTPYKLVYEKSCHLPIELKHKAYWALKHANFDLLTAGDHQKVQSNELNELREQAYENSLIYKEKTKRIHDFKIKDRVFNGGDRVLLFNSRLKIISSKLKTR